MMNFYAHSKDGQPPPTWQPLEEHLHNVADLAAQFAAPFGGQDWARLAGLWHDLGKYNPDFQRRLEGESIRVVHSEAGGQKSKAKRSPSPWQFIHNFNPHLHWAGDELFVMYFMLWVKLFYYLYIENIDEACFRELKDARL